MTKNVQHTPLGKQFQHSEVSVVSFILRCQGGVTGGWATAHPVFSRIEGIAALLFAQPALGNYLRP